METEKEQTGVEELETVEQAEVGDQQVVDAGVETDAEAEPETVQTEVDTETEAVAKVAAAIEKPRTVPESVFLEEKKRRKELERQLTERQIPLEKEEPIGPTCAAEAIKLGLIQKEDIITAEMDAQFDENKAKKEQRESVKRQWSDNNSAIAEFTSTITQDMEIAGLGMSDVVNANHIGNLTFRDQQEINSLPTRQQPKAIYDKLIERNPILKARHDLFFKKTKTNKKNTPNVNPGVAKTSSRVSGRNVNQVNILDLIRAGKSEEEIFRDLGT